MNMLAIVDKVYWRLYAARIQWQETADDSPEK